MVITGRKKGRIRGMGCAIKGVVCAIAYTNLMFSENL